MTETSIQPQLLGVYDTNNDGVLRKDDLCKVLKSLMIKNSMDFDVDFPFCSIVFFSFFKDVHLPSKARRLAHILFPVGCKEGQDHLPLDDFKKQLSR